MSSTGISALIRDKESPPPAKNGDRFALRILHLFALSSLTIAQPLLDLLGRHPEFFVVRGFSRSGLISLVVALLLLPPLPFVAVELLLLRTRHGLQRWVHLAFIALILTLFGLLVLKKVNVIPAVATIGLAMLLGFSAAAVYHHLTSAHTFVSLLGIALVAIPAVFFLNPAVVKLMTTQRLTASDPVSIPSTSPVVFIVFDELNLPVLANDQYLINHRRYPNLAALATRSTWYRNATTAAQFTTAAVPAILTGLLPGVDQLPNVKEHPRNLFTIFGTKYDLWVREPLTRMCPPELNRCKQKNQPLSTQIRILASDLQILFGHLVLPVQLSDRLPPIANAWGGFAYAATRETTPNRKEQRQKIQKIAVQATQQDRREELAAFLDALDHGNESWLYFIHVLLPHCPWNILPSGHRYPAEAGVWGVTDKNWCDNDYLTKQSYQRYILQVMYVDTFIGQMVQRFKELGFFDETLIVLTADHGTAFTPGRARRYVSYETAHEIVPVPLLIKAPHQQQGVVVDQMVSTIDILPTVLDLLNAEISWPLDGVSLGTAGNLPERPIKIRAYGRLYELRDELLQAKHDLVASKLRTFGDGTDPLSIYRFGPFPELLGLSAAELRQGPAAQVKLTIKHSELFRDVDLEGSILPVFIQGSFTSADRTGVLGLAVAVNGTIHATTQTHSDSGTPHRFTVMIPPSTLREEDNRIEVFLIDNRGGAPSLQRLLTD